jgi:hypothetical protein
LILAFNEGPGESIPSPKRTDLLGVLKVSLPIGVISNALKTIAVPMTNSYSANRRPGHYIRIVIREIIQDDLLHQMELNCDEPQRRSF